MQEVQARVGNYDLQASETIVVGLPLCVWQVSLCRASSASILNQLCLMIKV